jgi:hypothetical protein
MTSKPSLKRPKFGQKTILDLVQCLNWEICRDFDVRLLKKYSKAKNQELLNYQIPMNYQEQTEEHEVNEGLYTKEKTTKGLEIPFYSEMKIEEYWHAMK